jgi:hypothetical protein
MMAGAISSSLNWPGVVILRSLRSSQPRARRLHERGRPLPVLVAVAVLLATPAIYFQLTTHRGTAGVRQDSIVVLPFADLSSAKDQEYFGDGLTDEITNALSAVPGLTVIARTTAFQRLQGMVL